jgi:hypothetical protein
MGAHRKSIVRESIERLDGKMAINESRYAAKMAYREEHGATWSMSTGKIHSFKTRSVYQEHTIRFVKWAREVHHTTCLEQLDPQADELATTYLQQHIDQGKSPYTLAAERAALRLFFDNRALARDVQLPRRERSGITRSRGPVANDKHFQPANWQPQIRFLQGTGLRRHEASNLKIRDIYQDHSGQVMVHVESGKGGRMREVPVLAGKEQDILSLKGGRDPEARIFEKLPKRLDIHSIRREYAQALYLQYAPGRSLPPADRRLKQSDYDKAAVQRVSWALGHSRLSVVLTNYLR